MGAACVKSGLSGAKTSGEKRLEIATAVQNTKDYYGIGGHLECDRGPTLEAEDSQARAQILAPDAAMREHRRIAATTLDSVDVADRTFAPSRVAM